jgi:hypothetical protein
MQRLPREAARLRAEKEKKLLEKEIAQLQREMVDDL